MKSALILSLGVCFLTLSAAFQKELHATKNDASQEQKKTSPKLSKQEFSTAMNKIRQNIHTHEVVGPFPQSPHYGAMRYYGADDSSCQGNQVKVQTIILDTCLKRNEKGDSVQYSCSGGTPHMISYSDDACQTQVKSENGPMTCTQQDGGGSPLNDVGYWWIDCNSETVPDGKSYTARTHYATSPCMDNQIVSSDYFLNDYYCWRTGDSSSLKWSWPFMFLYDNAFCAGKAADRKPLDDLNCIQQDWADDDGGSFENTYYSYHNVGPIPQHPKLAIRGFRNGDHHTDKYPGNVEVHCFELREDGSAASVRGTYGQRGFFEGIIIDDTQNSHTASVNFYEVGYVGSDDLYVSTGSGLLQYDDWWNYNGGFYYSSGFESMSVNNSITDWGIDPNWGCGDDIRGCLGLDQSVSDVEIAYQYCLWDATGKKGYNSENVDYKPWWIFGKENPNTWYPTGLGYNTMTIGGPVVGAYRYTYSKDDCKDLNCKKDGNVEWGVYGLDTNIAQVGSGFIINSVWYATTGPFKKRNGAALYALVAGPGGKKQQIIGFFCNSKKNHDKNIWAGKVLTDCSYDNNMSQKPNKNLAVQLFQTYAKFGNWFEQWNTWATSVFGMGQGSHNQNQQQQQPSLARSNVHVNVEESAAADAPVKKSWAHAMKGYFRGENN